MATPPSLLAFAGSAREGSHNRKLLRIAAQGAGDAGARVTLITLGDFPLPVFDEDLEAREGEHPNAKCLKDLMRAHDGFLIASPENNSSYSALLKNAIDWASRRKKGEEPLECFAGKSAAILSASPGPMGGLRGLLTLAALLRNIRMIVLPDQLTIPRAHEAFTDQGELKDPQQKAAALQVGAALARFTAKLKA